MNATGIAEINNAVPWALRCSMPKTKIRAGISNAPPVPTSPRITPRQRVTSRIADVFSGMTLPPFRSVSGRMPPERSPVLNGIEVGAWNASNSFNTRAAAGGKLGD